MKKRTQLYCCIFLAIVATVVCSQIYSQIYLSPFSSYAFITNIDRLRRYFLHFVHSFVFILFWHFKHHRDCLRVQPMLYLIILLSQIPYFFLWLPTPLPFFCFAHFCCPCLYSIKSTATPLVCYTWMSLLDKIL